MAPPVAFNGSLMSPRGRTSDRADAAPLRIVIVEDELLIAMDIEMTVEDAGHEVVGQAMTADEAVQMVGRERPHAVLMDLRLANGSCGADAARRIRDRYGIRSIFLSGNLTPDKRAELADLEPLAMLNKPFSPVELAGALEAVIEKAN